MLILTGNRDDFLRKLLQLLEDCTRRYAPFYKNDNSWTKNFDICTFVHDH